MIDAYQALRLKTELLCKGLYLDENLIEHYKDQGIEMDYGRKGGAGPSGGRYFLFEDGTTLANIPLWNTPNRTELYLKENVDGYFEVFNENSKELFGKLKLIQNPKFYSPEYKTSDGIQMKKIALVHGLNCLSSTIYQKCVYWDCGEACSFCGIEVSLQNDATILEKNATQMSEVITVAKQEGRCSHMTLTSGTDETTDKGANRYIELLKGVKKDHPDIPIHVQIEALENLEYISKLKEAGADTIGIHLEVLNDSIRRDITPGKYHLSYQLFEQNWIHALDVFGNNQVSSYILTGFGENKAEFLKDVEKVISIGVVPYITPVRSIPGKKNLPITDYEEMLEIYQKAGTLMKQYGVNPLKTKAGCVKCGGCSAIKEAFKAT
ncbi:MAG: radical SAM protein [Promethearchaeota archaeon]|jgi:radical SAM protein (TIGR04043 family)